MPGNSLLKYLTDWFNNATLQACSFYLTGFNVVSACFLTNLLMAKYLCLHFLKNLNSQGIYRFSKTWKLLVLCLLYRLQDTVSGDLWALWIQLLHRNCGIINIFAFFLVRHVAFSNTYLSQIFSMVFPLRNNNTAFSVKSSCRKFFKRNVTTLTIEVMDLCRHFLTHLSISLKMRHCQISHIYYSIWHAQLREINIIRRLFFK